MDNNEFTCKLNADGIVDYMDSEATKKFTCLTNDEYVKRFDSYFGTVIKRTFLMM